MKLEPTITVCSDASISVRHEIATWACYIRTPDMTIKTGGVLKKYTPSTALAEQQGVANALHILVKAVDVSGFRLILYCDNVHAIGETKVSKKKRKESVGEQYLEFYNKNILPLLLKAKSYENRHVKAHVKRKNWSKISQRNYMNDWCDKHAKAIRRAEMKRRENEAK